jgi:hypothetical protein
MTSSTWRVLLLALCALTVVFAIVQLVDLTGTGGAPPWLGRWGFTFAPSPRPFDLVILSVDPNGPAAHSVLRPGDVIDIRQNTAAERSMILNAALNGRTTTLHILRKSTEVPIAVTPGPANARAGWSYIVSILGAMWIALFAGLIALRRSDVSAMRLLCLTLLFYSLGTVTDWATPWAWMSAVLASCAALGRLSVAYLAACAGCFGSPVSPFRKVTQWLCYGLVGVSIGLLFARVIGTMTLAIDPVEVWGPGSGVPFRTTIASVTWLAILMALLSAAFAIAASRSAERRRAVWSLAPPAILIVFGAAAVTAQFFLPSYTMVLALGGISGLAIFLTPLILAYVALSRRLLDVGFVLNRTVVFAVLSTIVVGAFVLVEWAVSKWFLSLNPTAGAIVDMVVALALGLSLRALHTFVERFIDRVFFRKRNENVEALRRFAHESAFITDRATLLDRTAREVRERTDVDAVAILTREGTDAYAFSTNDAGSSIGENDPAIVALRAWGKPVDLTALHGSELRGEFAFPMISRGTLVGALICGAKRDDEAYAPDESDALLAVAHGVGITLDAMSATGDRWRDAMFAAIRALPDAIADRLRSADAQRGAVDSIGAD